MTSPTPSNSSLSNSDNDSGNASSAAKCMMCKGNAASQPIFACFHSFCRACIEKIPTSAGSVLTCPICSKNNALPDAASSLFSADFGGVRSSSAAMSSGRTCSGCRRTDQSAEVVAQCYDCNNLLCSACELSHKQMSFFDRHRVVPVSSSSNSLTANMSAKPTYCLLHSSEIVAFFCHQCNVLMCRLCCAYDDPSHRRSPLPDAAGLDLDHLSSLEKMAEIRAAQLRVMEKNVENTAAYFREQYQHTKKAIGDAYEVFLKALEERRSEMFRELDIAFNDKQMGLRSTMQELKEVLDGLQQTRNILGLLPAYGNSAQSMLLKQSVAERLNSFLVYKPRLDLSNTTDVTFATDLPAIPKLVRNSFGAIQYRRRTVQQDQQSVVPYSVAQRSSPFEQQTSALEVALSLLDTNRVPLSSRSSSKAASPTTGVFDHWLNGASNSGPDIFALADMFITEGSGKVTPPTSMVQRQKMAFCCRFGESGSHEGQFLEPSGVAVNMLTGDILVADTNNHRVQVFDSEGTYRFQIGDIGKHDGALAYPNRVAVCRLTGNIVLTERSPTHQVQIFSSCGAFVRKFGSHVLQNPRGVTVDRQGNVIVVECKVQRVLVFCQQTGSILHKFSIMETVQFPNGVATSNRCDRIYISDNLSHCIKIFTYDGVHLGNIGEQGITNYPIGVGIGPNGEIVVADNHNNFNLTVFSTDGRLLAALESKVKHNQCYDVAFADNGTVVVACKDYHVYVYHYFEVGPSPSSTAFQERDIQSLASSTVPASCRC